jgi:Fe2+ transport system protein B
MIKIFKYKQYSFNDKSLNTNNITKKSLKTRNSKRDEYTQRRDKSILHSRATITILLMAAFITYDYVFIVFLAKTIC